MVRRQGLAKERTQNIEMRLWGSCINIKDVSWANKPVAFTFAQEKLVHRNRRASHTQL